MKTIILDGNIYNLIDNDGATKKLIHRMIESEKIEVAVPRIVLEELKSSPFKGVPDFFPIKNISDGVAVAGLAIADAVIVGDGNTYSSHLGTSKKSKDAVLAETANNYSDIFVSEDIRCRKRLNNIQSKVKFFNYEEFCAWLQNT